MNINFLRKKDIDIISISGEIILTNVDEIKNFVDSLIEKDGIRKIVFNLKETEFIDSSGIGLLIEFKSRLKKMDGQMVLINLNEEIKNLLSIANLLDFLITAENEEEAIQYLNKN